MLIVQEALYYTLCMHYSINQWGQYYYYYYLWMMPKYNRTRCQPSSNNTIHILNHYVYRADDRLSNQLNGEMTFWEGQGQVRPEKLRAGDWSDCTNFWKHVTGWISRQRLRGQSMCLYTNSPKAWESLSLFGQDPFQVPLPLTKKAGCIPLAVGLTYSWIHFPSSTEKVKFYSVLMSEYTFSLDSEFSSASLKSNFNLTIPLWNGIQSVTVCMGLKKNLF